MLVIGLVTAGGKAEGFSFELARAGLGVVAVAFLGGLAAASFRIREEERASKLREDAYRAEFVSDLWDAYHEIKGVRRALMAAGFRDATRLTSDYIEALEKQMPRLDAAQLTLEKLFRTVLRERKVFDPYDDRLLVLLRFAENYANEVLKDWKKHRLRRLPSFLGGSKERGGIKYLSVAVERAADLVYALRSGSGGRLPTDRDYDCDLHSFPPPDDDAGWEGPDCKQTPAEKLPNTPASR